MLDEQEYAEALRRYGECMKATKEFRQRWNVPLEDASIHQRFGPLREWYQRISGFPDCHQNAILHHRVSNFGAPCRVCGKPLRSPRARLCAACGAAV
jgi:hypothetical protein